MASNAYVETGFATPTGLYANQLSSAGVRLCYSVGGGVQIASTVLNVRSSTAGFGTVSAPVYDSTVRTDAGCTTFAVPSPQALSAGDTVSLWLTVGFGAGTYVDLTTATLILVPSGSALTPLSRPVGGGSLAFMKPFKGRLPGSSK